MQMLGQTTLGIAILALLALMVASKWAATGAILDRPHGNFLVQLVNIFNLFFLLVVNPLAAILLIAGRMDTIDPTHFSFGPQPVTLSAEALGLLLYVGGVSFMGWALLVLGRNYQLGGSVPRPEDELITNGPYRFVRHPMYAAALSIAAGLALLIQSGGVLCVLLVYLLLIRRLIPLEEERLSGVYGERFATYRQRTGSLLPHLPVSAGDS